MFQISYCKLWKTETNEKKIMRELTAKEEKNAKKEWEGSDKETEQRTRKFTGKHDDWELKGWK